MANAYPVLYRLGVTPWEANRDDGPLAEVLATRPPGRALDAGCGTGRHAVSIAEHGWTVTGVDGVGQALRKASARAETAGVGDRATFVQGDVAHLDSVLGEERYDLVLDIGCFHGLTDPDRIAFAGWVTRHTADGAVLLLHIVLPRSGIGPRGVDDSRRGPPSRGGVPLVRPAPPRRRLGTGVRTMSDPLALFTRLIDEAFNAGDLENLEVAGVEGLVDQAGEEGEWVAHGPHPRPEPSARRRRTHQRNTAPRRGPPPAVVDSVVDSDQAGPNAARTPASSMPLGPIPDRIAYTHLRAHETDS